MQCTATMLNIGMNIKRHHMQNVKGSLVSLMSGNSKSSQNPDSLPVTTMSFFIEGRSLLSD